MVKNRRFPHLFLATFLTAVSQFSFAQILPNSGVDPSCRSVPVDHSYVKQRSGAVTFPNGRKVTVIGHNHGTRQIYDLIRLNNEGKLKSMSNEEFDNLLQSILQENRKIGVRTTLQDAQQDLHFIYENIRTVEFIGYEGSPEGAKDNLLNYILVKHELDHQFEMRKAHGLRTTEAEFKLALLSSMNANAYVFTKDPKLVERVAFLGTEDESAGTAHSRARPVDQLDNAIEDINQTNQKHWESLDDDEAEGKFLNRPDVKAKLQMINSLYIESTLMTFDSLDEVKRKIASLRTHPFPWLNAEIEKFLAAVENRIQLNTARDYHSALALASAQKTGIHFVGQNHLKSTLRYLESMCMTELNASKISAQVESASSAQ